MLAKLSKLQAFNFRSTADEVLNKETLENVSMQKGPGSAIFCNVKGDNYVDQDLFKQKESFFLPRILYLGINHQNGTQIVLVYGFICANPSLCYLLSECGCMKKM